MNVNNLGKMGNPESSTNLYKYQWEYWKLNHHRNNLIFKIMRFNF